MLGATSAVQPLVVHVAFGVVFGAPASAALRPSPRAPRPPPERGAHYMYAPICRQPQRRRGRRHVATGLVISESPCRVKHLARLGMESCRCGAGPRGRRCQSLLQIGADRRAVTHLNQDLPRHTTGTRTARGSCRSARCGSRGCRRPNARKQAGSGESQGSVTHPDVKPRTVRRFPQHRNLTRIGNGTDRVMVRTRARANARRCGRIHGARRIEIGDVDRRRAIAGRRTCSVVRCLDLAWSVAERFRHRIRLR